MSVTTSRALDEPTFHATVGGPFTWTGRSWGPGPKTFTGTDGTTDQQLQAAVTAAGDVVDTNAANLATIIQQLKGAKADNDQFIATANPTNAQVVAYLKSVARQLNGLERLAYNDLTGTGSP